MIHIRIMEEPSDSMPSKQFENSTSKSMNYRLHSRRK